MSNAIEFDHVGKQYRLGMVGTGTLHEDLHRFWEVNVLHHEDPFLKVGQVNDRSQVADGDYVWALRDINFTVEQGDVVGIIGKNGAGKSTLLKLLSRVTNPTTGVIRSRGRIASLLEVGTGFHGELTGRENIYINGSILGMTKQEIDSKLDEIIAFSGCEKYIDTPVKRYSSGMTVRLGFAVAAFLEPEILVVDEVLAVGDAEFQKKAIGKMQDVSRGEGRTVLFVSHNMASVRQLCTRGVLLENGMVKLDGSVNDVVDAYLSDQLDVKTIDRVGPGDVTFTHYSLKNKHIELGDDLWVEFGLKVQKEYYSELLLSIDIADVHGMRLVHIINSDSQLKLEYHKGDEFMLNCVIRNINLTPGKYNMSLWVGTMQEQFEQIKYCIDFVVEQGNRFILREMAYPANCPLVLRSDWEKISD